jgi:hypothetical protein
VAIVYGAAVTVVLNLLFLPDSPKAAEPTETEKGPSRTGVVYLCPTRSRIPRMCTFALKVTFAAMFCYIFYMAIDWSGSTPR